MDNWYTNELNAKYTQQRANGIIEQQRIEKLAMAAQPRHVGFTSRILLSAGCWLVARGWQLQQKCAEEQVIHWGSIEVRHSIGC